MNQDSWCTVERTASQDWTRAERKHSKHAFDSKVFESITELSTNRVKTFQADDRNHSERRHFYNKCKELIFIRICNVYLRISFYFSKMNAKPVK